MHIKRLWKVGVALLFMLTVSGCGDGNSNSNGTLLLTADAPVSGAGTADMVATATVTPATTTGTPVLVGIKVNLVAIHFGFDPTPGAYTELLPRFSQSAFTDFKGTATFAHSFGQSTSFPTTLQVTATCEGLSQTKNIAIPKYVP